jgi:hypothetical protein
MSDKIKAYFGADVSGFELEMLKAQRATKAYERAVNAIDKGPSGFASLNKDAPKTVGIVKELISKFGMAGAAAGLVPGLGVAAVGVAGLVAGVKYVADKYKEAAESAKEIADSMMRSVQRRISEDDSLSTNKERLDLARKQTEELKTQWQGSVLAGMTDNEIMANREKFEISAQKMRELARKVERESAEERENEQKKHSAQVEADFRQELSNHKRNDEVQKKIDESQREADEMRSKELERIQENHIKWIEKEAAAQKEADDLRYERAWRFASDEQKIAQVRKEGRAAQAAYDKEQSAENLVALEKARGKWIDLRDQIQGAKKDTDSGGDKLATGGRERGGDGRLRRNGVVISDEDATSTDKTKDRNAKLQSEAKRGEIKGGKGIGDSGQEVAKNTADLLKELQSLTSKFN